MTSDNSEWIRRDMINEVAVKDPQITHKTMPSFSQGASELHNDTPSTLLNSGSLCLLRPCSIIGRDTAIVWTISAKAVGNRNVQSLGKGLSESLGPAQYLSQPSVL